MCLRNYLMKAIYNNIKHSISKGEPLLAVLIDPDKMKPEGLSGFLKKLNTSVATHIFVGGSTVDDEATEATKVMEQARLRRIQDSAAGRIKNEKNNS